MFTDILNIFTLGVASCWTWFQDLWDAIVGNSPFYMVMIVVFLSYRFILRPILGGSAGSDKAKKKDGTLEDD